MSARSHDVQRSLHVSVVLPYSDCRTAARPDAHCLCVGMVAGPASGLGGRSNTYRFTVCFRHGSCRQRARRSSVLGPRSGERQGLVYDQLPAASRCGLAVVSARVLRRHAPKLAGRVNTALYTGTVLTAGSLEPWRRQVHHSTFVVSSPCRRQDCIDGFGGIVRLGGQPCRGRKGRAVCPIGMRVAGQCVLHQLADRKRLGSATA